MWMSNGLPASLQAHSHTYHKNSSSCEDKKGRRFSTQRSSFFRSFVRGASQNGPEPRTNSLPVRPTDRPTDVRLLLVFLLFFFFPREKSFFFFLSPLGCRRRHRRRRSAAAGWCASFGAICVFEERAGRIHPKFSMEKKKITKKEKASRTSERRTCYCLSLAVVRCRRCRRRFKNIEWHEAGDVITCSALLLFHLYSLGIVVVISDMQKWIEKWNSALGCRWLSISSRLRGGGDGRYENNKNDGNYVDVRARWKNKS